MKTMTMAKLTKKEKEIELNILKARYRSVDEETLTEYKKLLGSDDNTKSSRINIRISPEVLVRLKLIAAEQGIPYQSLISSILHKYVNDAFVEVKDLVRIKKIIEAA